MVALAAAAGLFGAPRLTPDVLISGSSSVTVSYLANDGAIDELPIGFYLVELSLLFWAGG